MPRAPLPLLLAALLASACSSGARVDPALVEAGRRLRREQPPPTAAELRLEVDSFLDNELPLLREKAGQELEREVRLWRNTVVVGAALGVLASSSGSVSASGGTTKALLVGAGGAAAIAGGVVYYLRAPKLRACQAFLDSARTDVASFRKNAIPPGEEPVAPAVWHSWVDRVAAIRSHPGCSRLR
jgi:hypothetical protein